MLLTLLVHGLHTLREPPLHSNSNGSWKESEGAQFLKPSELKDHLQQNNFKGHLYLSGACSPVKRARWLCVHRGDPEPHRTLRALCDLKCERELEPQRNLEPPRDFEPSRDFDPCPLLGSFHTAVPSSRSAVFWDASSGTSDFGSPARQARGRPLTFFSRVTMPSHHVEE